MTPLPCDRCGNAPTFRVQRRVADPRADWWVRYACSCNCYQASDWHEAPTDAQGTEGARKAMRQWNIQHGKGGWAAYWRRT